MVLPVFRQDSDLGELSRGPVNLRQRQELGKFCQLLYCRCDHEEDRHEQKGNHRRGEKPAFNRNRHGRAEFARRALAAIL